jgi:hypothetical protein
MRMVGRSKSEETVTIDRISPVDSRSHTRTSCSVAQCWSSPTWRRGGAEIVIYSHWTKAVLVE